MELKLAQILTKWVFPILGVVAWLSLGIVCAFMRDEYYPNDYDDYSEYYDDPVKCYAWSGRRFYCNYADFSIVFPGGADVCEDWQNEEVTAAFDAGMSGYFTINYHDNNEALILDEILVAEAHFWDSLYSADPQLREFLDSLVVYADTQMMYFNQVPARRILQIELSLLEDLEDSITSVSYLFAIDQWQYDVSYRLDTDSFDIHSDKLDKTLQSFRYQGGAHQE